MTFVENISSSVAWSLYHDICDNIPNTRLWNNMKAAAICQKKLLQNSRERYHVFHEWSYAHLSNFNNLCALSNIVSLFIKFDVRNKCVFTSFFLMFTRHKQTKSVFATAYRTEITVWCRWMLWFCLSTWSWKAFSCSLACSVSWRDVGIFTSITW